MEEKEVDNEVLEAAIRLFGGNEIQAINWLNTPARALGGVKPVDSNVEDVYRLIGQLEYGVYN